MYAKPRTETFGSILRERAERSPDALAFIYLRDGETDEERISFGELHERARRYAASLESAVEPGGRALLLLPPGLDYVAALFGCFYAKIVGVSVAPPHPKRLHRTLPRLLAIAKDADPDCVLTSTAIRNAAKMMLEPGQPLAASAWLTDEDGEEVAGALRGLGGDGSELAFLQYTSGSTGDPRGVVLTQANLVANCGVITRAFGLSADNDVGFSWLPPYHDMGLIGGILTPIYVGGPSVLISPLAVVKRPMRWLEGISRYRATTSGGPNFAYELCTRRFEEKSGEGLDLSCWRVAFNGAEPIRVGTLDAFCARFERFGFRRATFLPCYGLAEATLMVTAADKEAPPALRVLDADALEAGQLIPVSSGTRKVNLVGCGKPDPEHEVAIVDPVTRHRAALGEIGEIWVSGASVAGGYWRRGEETEGAFEVELASEPGSRFLRTGDLGALVDGELCVVGRIKDMLIVNGRNIYPHDIEESAEAAHELLRPHCSAAFGSEELDDSEVAIVLEVDELDAGGADEVAAAVRRRVAADMDLRLQTVVLCTPGSVPKTTSGKVQRRLCRSLMREGALEVLAESTWAEAR